MGLMKYIMLVKNHINTCKTAVTLVGFSIGASAIWANSQNKDLHPKSHAICFYGSKIRNFVDIYPTIKVQLFFPLNEKHFNVSHLIAKLKMKDRMHRNRASTLPR